jgi:hypothetical protein
VSSGIALPFHDLHTYMVVVQYHAPAALPPEKDPVSIVQEARWAPGAGLETEMSTTNISWVVKTAGT